MAEWYSHSRLFGLWEGFQMHLGKCAGYRHPGATSSMKVALDLTHHGGVEDGHLQ